MDEPSSGRARLRAHRDLAGVALLAVVAAATVQIDDLPGVVRAAAGLGLVLVLPGYALTRAALSQRIAGAAERIALSLALSVPATILSGLLINLSPWRLSVSSWSLTLAGVVVAGCAVAATRRPRSRAPERSVWRLAVPDGALLGAAVAVTGGALALGFTSLPPPRGTPGYTELWLLPRGRAIELGLQSRELKIADYEVRLRGGGRQIRSWTVLSIRPGERWTVKLRPKSIKARGPVEARLYRIPSDRIYRRVRLRRVAARPQAGAQPR